MMHAKLRSVCVSVRNACLRRFWRLRHYGGVVDYQAALRRPRLFVDMSVITATDARTGIQRVVRAIWQGLLNEPQSRFDVVAVAASRQHGYCYADPAVTGGALPTGAKPYACVQAGAGDHFLGLDLNAHLLPTYRWQLQCWRGAGLKCHIVVYDILPVTHPEYFPAVTRSRFVKWLGVIATCADQAMCISDDVRHQLSSWLRMAGTGHGPAVSVIPLGYDMAASLPSHGMPEGVSDLLTRMACRPSVLIVGTIEPRKGHAQVLDAFDLLWQDADAETPLLIIVGRPGWMTEALQGRFRHHPELGKRLFWFSNASDEFLERLYLGCSGVLLASRAEGFGLPLIEAAGHKKPVLCRDLAVFHECAIGDVLYFQAENGPELAVVVKDWLAKKYLREIPESTVPPSWRDCVSTVFSLLYEHALPQR